MALRKIVTATLLLAAGAGAGLWYGASDARPSWLADVLKMLGGGPAAVAAQGTVPTKAGSPVRSVRVVRPEPAPGTSTLTLSGRTAAAEQAYISSRASGVVSERLVDIGDRVQAGDVLLRIEAPEVAQELSRARATIGQIEARLQLARLELERAENLVPKGHVSVQTRDERLTAKASAEADLAAAHAEVKRLEEIQSFQTMRAPFSGTVVARQVERGDRVSAAQTQQNSYLLRVARLDELRIEIDVPQSSALAVRQGAPARVTFAELAGETFTASIVRVAGLIEQESGTMRAELIMPNPEGRIPAGLNGQVAIEVGSASGAVLVPTNTLMTRDGRQMVAVIDEQSLVRIKPIAVARDLGQRVVISSGLSAHDRVIVSPNALLREGDQVEVVTPTAAR